jgi:hypothetical protein
MYHNVIWPRRQCPLAHYKNSFVVITTLTEKTALIIEMFVWPFKKIPYKEQQISRYTMTENMNEDI